MNAPHETFVADEAIVFSLNGTNVSAAPGETIIEAADRLGVAIPRLCYKPGSCRPRAFPGCSTSGGSRCRDAQPPRAETRPIVRKQSGHST
jgi:hypothetical protein